jgi:hypothetical protein
VEQSSGEAGGGRRWKEDHFTNTEKFRGLAVNYNFPLFYESNEKVPKMKVVQFFKIYNFHVVQIFTRSKDFEIFSKVQMNSI